jgi:hypothetical protein
MSKRYYVEERHCYVCNASESDPCHAVDGQVAECPRPSRAPSLGMRIEEWVLYGMPSEPLTPKLRSEVREFAEGFEECGASHDALVDMGDHDLIRAAYQAMADYARGQL